MIAERIGPVFGVDDLAEWLAPPKTIDEIRSAAKQRFLVGFETDDKKWAFPEWGFKREHGHLILRPEVVALWQALPHDGFLTAVDLAAWMNTRFESLETRTPARRVTEHGMDDPALQTAVVRLHSRAS